MPDQHGVEIVGDEPDELTKMRAERDYYKFVCEIYQRQDGYLVSHGWKPAEQAVMEAIRLREAAGLL